MYAAGTEPIIGQQKLRPSGPTSREQHPGVSSTADHGLRSKGNFGGRDPFWLKLCWTQTPVIRGERKEGHGRRVTTSFCASCRLVEVGFSLKVTRGAAVIGVETPRLNDPRPRGPLYPWSVIPRVKPTWLQIPEAHTSGLQRCRAQTPALHSKGSSNLGFS